MFTTTFAAAALSVLFAGEMAAVGPTWQTDYTKAMASAVAQQKPLIVFIGKGDAGYAKLVGEGQIPTDAIQLLAKSYVCVYLDTDTAAGKALASDFALTQGVVISSRGGSYQALRHTGPVSPTVLNGYLTQYSEVKVVTTTERGGEGLVSSTISGTTLGGCANGRCPTVVSGGYTYPATQYVIPGYTYGSSCPNGKCPNAR